MNRFRCIVRRPRWLGLLAVGAAVAAIGSGWPAGEAWGERLRGVAQARPAPAVTAERVEILWDGWGVPHVFARDLESLFHAYGWAQMASHADLVLRLYGEARGRAAEYWGEQNLESDRWIRTVGIPQRATEWWAAQSTESRRNLEAFVDGMNEYAREHPELVADSVEVVLPLQVTDVLAHMQRVIHFDFVLRVSDVHGSIRRWRGRSSGWTAVPMHPDGERVADAASAAGSNAWAVAPSRSAGGNALLLANPHLPWADHFVFYESHLVTPGLDAYGAALVGFPVLGIAFNEHLGWTHTVNTYDGADLYELTAVEEGYRWDGEVRPYETDVQTLEVRQADGTLRSEELVVRRSVHGPVVAEKEGGRALALRVAGLDQPHLIDQYLEMMRARNLAEFELALKRLQMPMFTVLYADRDGRIMHLFGGRVPVRPAGDFEWAGVVPGDARETVWTATHAYAELPRVVDPPSGWLQNANDPPWTTTFPEPLDPAHFPAYMAPSAMHLRAQRSARMLSEDESITFDELVAYKHSTRMELADRILPDLVAAARTHGGEAAERAAAVLESWDRSADAGSRGAVLFQEWFREYSRLSGPRGPFASPWQWTEPLSTPRGLADADEAAAALEAAAGRVEERFGALDVSWGTVYRLQRDDVDLPANGGSGALGIFRVVGYGAVEDGRAPAVGGDGFVAAIEFSEPVRARVLLGYGNASQPGSPHRTDQLPLMARKELRPALLTRPEIEAELSARKAF